MHRSIKTTIFVITSLLIPSVLLGQEANKAPQQALNTLNLQADCTILSTDGKTKKPINSQKKEFKLLTKVPGTEYSKSEVITLNKKQFLVDLHVSFEKKREEDYVATILSFSHPDKEITIVANSVSPKKFPIFLHGGYVGNPGETAYSLLCNIEETK